MYPEPESSLHSFCGFDLFGREWFDLALLTTGGLVLRSWWRLEAGNRFPDNLYGSNEGKRVRCVLIKACVTGAATCDVAESQLASGEIV